jgi:hypothetical protein
MVVGRDRPKTKKGRRRPHHDTASIGLPGSSTASRISRRGESSFDADHIRRDGRSVRTVSVSALGEYVDLKTAVAESRRLFDELKSQAFDYAERDAATGGYAKFYLARGNVLTNPRPPRTVNSFQEMEAIFLDSRLYLEEFLVFAMRKADLEVTLRVTNMRRRHTENQMATTGRTPSIQDRAAEEARAFDRTRLEKEHVYYLEVFIGRPLGSLQAR